MSVPRHSLEDIEKDKQYYIWKDMKNLKHCSDLVSTNFMRHYSVKMGNLNHKIAEDREKFSKIKNAIKNQDVMKFQTSDCAKRWLIDTMQHTIPDKQLKIKIKQGIEQKYLIQKVNLQRS